MTKRIIILYTMAGGGHQSAAYNLQEIIRQNTNWDVQMVNPIADWCGEYDLFKKFTSMSAEDFYNKNVSASNDPLLRLFAVVALLFLNLTIYAKKIRAKLLSKWHELQPDLIISVCPFINKAVMDSVSKYHGATQFVTLITDFDECYPGIWIVSKQQTVLCASQRIKQLALKFGVPPDNVYQLSGLPVKSAYYLSAKLDQKILRSSYNLDPDVTTGLVIFGTYGSSDMLQIAKRMCAYIQPIQLIFVCGYNEELRQKLANLQLSYKVIVTGFIDYVDRFMRCADFVIGKPGGLIIAESVTMQVPLILKLNAATLLQERYNAQWVIENNLGVSMTSLKQIDYTVAEFLPKIALLKENFKRFPNTACFEIPGILDQVMRS